MTAAFCGLGFSDSAADDRDWVLQGDPFDWCIEQGPNEVEGFGLLFLHLKSIRLHG